MSVLTDNSILEILPCECVLSILKTLSSADLINISRTSRYAYEISTDEYLWQQLIYDIYGMNYKIIDVVTWYRHFVGISELFTPSHVCIINKLRKISPQWDFFKLLYQHEIYRGLSDVGVDDGSFKITIKYISLTEIVVYSKGDTVQICVPINSSYRYMLMNLSSGYIPQSQSVVNVPNEVLESLKNKQHYIDEDTQIFAVIFNRKHLETMGRFMYR